MPRLDPPSSSSLAPSLRRRPRKSLVVAAVTAAIALVSGPISAHAAADGLRGSGGGGPHQPQHDIAGHERQLLLLEEEEKLDQDQGEASSQLERDLAPRGTNNRAGSNGINQVTIEPFTANLLSPNFPYKTRYSRDNEFSGAMASYLAPFLNYATGTTVVNLGMDCEKTRGNVGVEQRYVLKCKGLATFDEMPNKKVVGDAVRDAFLGPNQHAFLKEMYIGYEYVHEKSQFNRAHVMARGRKKPTKTGNRAHVMARGRKKPTKKKGKKSRKKGKKPKKKGKKPQKKGKKPQKMSGGMQQFSSGGGGRGNPFGYDAGSVKPNSNSNSGYNGGNVDGKGNIVVQVRGGGR